LENLFVDPSKISNQIEEMSFLYFSETASSVV
jgi:hypothetical protein